MEFGSLQTYVNKIGVFALLNKQLRIQYLRLLNHDSFPTNQLPGGAAVTYPMDRKVLAVAIRFFNSSIWALILIGFALRVIFPWGVLFT